MQLFSPEFSEGHFLSKKHEYNAFGGTGENTSPALIWNDVPCDAKSLALTLYDPDAPTGSGFWHWIVYNIPPDFQGFASNSGDPSAKLIPNITQGRNDYGTFGFGGACPPEGDKPHRYIFTLHALSLKRLDIDNDMPNAVIRFIIYTNQIAKVSLSALYQR
ncbi:YbhB/YbcL family Raf kinase inhibitor-like protein [Bartonella sp. DGB2]|uniref:YbhB/YbcL family Raf kinase inhibitor-like protein n=1 Tax=Bartonella sp. DGB2 TaxID=3388426 RepID=UPI00398F9EA8